jgi:hypothetical protein
MLTYHITEHGTFSSGSRTRREDVLRAARCLGKYSYVYGRQRCDSVVMERVIVSMCVASCGTDADPRTQLARMHRKLLITEH